jgi:pSer/pThr/pTyr-binding forkhead associated (FHA) protein
MSVNLVLLDGKHKGRQIPIPETIFLVGRDSQCHLRPHCEAVSQMHCVIAAWGGKIRVCDLASRNGTLVNGHAIRSEISVEDGDEIQIGSLKFQVRISTFKGKSKGQVSEPMDWLLDSSNNAHVLSPGFGTWLMSAHIDGQDVGGMKSTRIRSRQASPPTPSRSKTISAGTPLRSQIEKGHK